jgi:phosphate transport system permease protein
MSSLSMQVDWVWSLIMRIAASTTIVCVALIFLFVFRETLPVLLGPDVTKLLSDQWRPVSPVHECFGLLPLINGSFLVTTIAILFSLPVSIMTATYIAYIARPRESQILKAIIELLASIPSVVVGFIGLVFLVPLVKEVLGLQSGLNALTGGLILGLMAAPTIVTLAEDALRAVPSDYREASLALGASEITTIFRVLIPAASRGILAAALLGLGRIMGETMAVLMVTGNAPILTLSPLSPVRTITATIASEMGEVVFGGTHYHALFVLGALLLSVTFVINLIAQLIIGGKFGGNRAHV